MTEIIKIGILGVLGVMLAIQLKANKPEYGVYIGLAISILIFCYGMKQAQVVIREFEKIRNILGDSRDYLSILLRVIGVTYICEFSAGICKDAGFGSVAEQIEILGKVSVLLAGIPILFSVINQIQSLMS